MWDVMQLGLVSQWTSGSSLGGGVHKMNWAHPMQQSHREHSQKTLYLGLRPIRPEGFPSGKSLPASIMPMGLLGAYCLPFPCHRRTFLDSNWSEHAIGAVDAKHFSPVCTRSSRESMFPNLTIPFILDSNTLP